MVPECPAAERKPMIQRELQPRPEYIYPPDEWRMVEKKFNPDLPVFNAGTYVNGFYESWPIVYGEQAFGFAKTGQTIVNVPDSRVIKLYVDDEPFSLPTANLIEFERTLDMKNGTLDREIVWETPAGKRVRIRSRRLVSFEHRHLAAISYQVTVLNASAPVVISSELVTEHVNHDAGGDPRRHRGFRGRVLVPRKSYSRDHRMVLAHVTKNSKMSVACGVDHFFETACPYFSETSCQGESGKVVFSVKAKRGIPINLTKFMTYHTSRSAPPEELCERAERTLNRTQVIGFQQLLASQRRFVDDFWRRSDVEVEGDPAIQQAIRFNLFQVLQAAGRAEGSGIPAKGLTGDGYEGHYFWDIEIYVMPFLTYTMPRIARNLLSFRAGFLDKARMRAREVNQKGALFPWRTINGEEASAYYAAGTAQYHINADIIHALKKYVDATGDEEFLQGTGAELLVETARLWRDLGFFSKRRKGQFCINGVTGPDEYNTVVNNNTYTNMMALENLRYAADTLESLKKTNPKRFGELVHEIHLQESEIGEWREAAEKMRIPFDDELGIHPQDDNFLEKEPWDLENTPPEKFPLLLYHHPLVIYRKRVVKQADVVLAMFLCGPEFSVEQKRRNYEYYDHMTTGDSSLSASIQCIIAAEVGHREKAEEYGRYALLMDLADVSGNVKDGCHIASMGGTWMAIVYGLAGMRDHDGLLSFRPHIPGLLDRVKFPLTVRGQMLDVDITKESVTYSLRKGEELVIRHEDEEIRLTRAKPAASRSLLGAAAS
jgi:alpha,alpha-trehalose phosphorylase